MSSASDHADAILLQPGKASLALLRRIFAGSEPVQLDPAARDVVTVSRQTVEAALADGGALYGINTGFGILANTRIPDDRLAELQRNLVLSHAAGTGALLSGGVVRLIMVLKVLSLARGFSGVRLEVVDALLAMINGGVCPCVPAKGSVGASGDLAPLAHVAATVIGVGEATVGGRRMSAVEALASVGLKPIELGPKEGLALLNGTQVSTALALAGLFAIEDVFAAALVAGALSTEALKGSDAPHDPRIHEARGQPGQIAVAAVSRELLDGSEILLSHRGCAKVQDPYSFRCQPQVMGACLDLMRNAAATLEVEANAATDNPLIFSEEGDVVSGGNFHAEPVALAADTLALAIAEIGSLSERRTAVLVDPKMSGLPAFLVQDSGLNSGFMIAQVTAAALVSENKQMAHPASVDTVPTSANQEDHVSMATHAARRLTDMADNAAGVVAVELLAGAQGIDFHAPLTTSAKLAEALAQVRAKVPHYVHDRFFAPDIEAAKALVESSYFRAFTSSLLPSGG